MTSALVQSFHDDLAGHFAALQATLVAKHESALQSLQEENRRLRAEVAATAAAALASSTLQAAAAAPQGGPGAAKAAAPPSKAWEPRWPQHAAVAVAGAGGASVVDEDTALGRLTAQKLQRLQRLAGEVEDVEADGVGPSRYRVRVQEPLEEPLRAPSAAAAAAGGGPEARNASAPDVRGRGEAALQSRASPENVKAMVSTPSTSASSGGQPSPSPGAQPVDPYVPQGPLAFIGGPGKAHYFVPDHIRGGIAEPGGLSKDTDFEDGLERCIGHGRRHVPTVDHITEGLVVEGDDWLEKLRRRKRYIGALDHLHGYAAVDDPPGAHGHAKDAALQGGMPRAIGHGKHHIPMQDHIVAGSAVVEQPGLHGHNRDDDFEEGLQRGIGHGRRHLESGLEAYLRANGPQKAAPRSASAPRLTLPSRTGVAAGMPSRPGAWGGPSAGIPAGVGRYVS